jgi:DinB superfamily
MTGVDEALEGNRAAVNELIAAAERAAGSWTTPRVPGKWSMSQVVEHVVRALEESANVVAGVPSKFPSFPAFVRPLVRGLFFNRVLKTGTFPKSKTNKPFDPIEGPATPAAGRTRLEAALAVFERESRTCAAKGAAVASSIFGRVGVADYAKFQEYHTRHHTRQVHAGN